MTYANLYAIFFGIFVIWFCFSSVCSLVLDYFAGDAFVAGDIDHIDYSEITELIFWRVTSRVADDTTERRKADGDYCHKEKDSLHYCCFYFVFCQ